jgi:ABC-type transport system substrate-binding protein
MAGEANYWTRLIEMRRSRRGVLRGAGLAGLGLTAAGLLGCNSTGSKSSGQPGSSAGAGSPAASGNAGVSGLVGSTGTQPPASEVPVRGGTFVYVQGANMQGLDPQNTSATASLVPLSGPFSRPFRFKVYWDVNQSNNREVIPDLATSAESPDGMTWTLKLRPDAKFHNIPPVNAHNVEAQDFLATYQRALTPGSVASGGLSMLDASQIQAPDKNTIVFKLKYPFANFKNILASGQYSWIFPREVAGGYDPKTTVIGSGPFLWDSYTPDVAINMKRNPDYFDKPHPYVDAVKIAIVPDPNQQFAQFTSGQLDYLGNGITDANLPTYQKQNPQAQTITNWGPGDAQIYYKVQEAGSPFKDIRLRQAMSMALDRDALSKAAFDGKSTPCFYSPQSLGKWSLKMDQLPAETAQYYKFDLAKAKQLASAAGASSMQIKYLSPSPYPSSGENPWFRVMREATAAMLKELPWQINLVLLDSAREWINSGKGVRYGNFSPDSAVWAGLEGHNDVDEYIFAWYDSQSTSDIGKLKDDQLESMIIKGRSILNDDDRLKQYIDIQKYMAAQLFSVAGNPNGLSFYMISPRIRNYSYGDNYGAMTGSVANVWIKK